MVEQVGGTHYQSGYIHWDFVLATGMQYLEGNATKYLSRWSKKGTPLMDLEKALSYVVKITENVPYWSMKAQVNRPYKSVANDEAKRFCHFNDITGPAREAVIGLAIWESNLDINSAAIEIRQLIGWFKRSGLPPDWVRSPAAAPLDDSNKHAPRKEA